MVVEYVDYNREQRRHDAGADQGMGFVESVEQGMVVEEVIQHEQRRQDAGVQPGGGDRSEGWGDVEGSGPEEEPDSVEVLDVLTWGLDFLELYWVNDEVYHSERDTGGLRRRVHVATYNSEQESVAVNGRPIAMHGTRAYEEQRRDASSRHQAQVPFNPLECAYPGWGGRPGQEDGFLPSPAMEVRLDWEGSDEVELRISGELGVDFEWPEGATLLVTRRNEAVFILDYALRGMYAHHRPWGHMSTAAEGEGCILEPMTEEAESRVVRALQAGAATLMHFDDVYVVPAGVVPLAFWVALWELDCAWTPSFRSPCEAGRTYHLAPRLIGGGPKKVPQASQPRATPAKAKPGAKRQAAAPAPMGASAAAARFRHVVEGLLKCSSASAPGAAAQLARLRVAVPRVTPDEKMHTPENLLPLAAELCDLQHFALGLAVAREAAECGVGMQVATAKYFESTAEAGMQRAQEAFERFRRATGAGADSGGAKRVEEATLKTSTAGPASAAVKATPGEAEQLPTPVTTAAKAGAGDERKPRHVEAEVSDEELEALISECMSLPELSASRQSSSEVGSSDTSTPKWGDNQSVITPDVQRAGKPAAPQAPPAVPVQPNPPPPSKRNPANAPDVVVTVCEDVEPSAPPLPPTPEAPATPSSSDVPSRVGKFADKLKGLARGRAASGGTRAQAAAKAVGESIRNSNARAAGDRDALHEMIREAKGLEMDFKRCVGAKKDRYRARWYEMLERIDRLKERLAAGAAEPADVEKARRELAAGMLDIGAKIAGVGDDEGDEPADEAPKEKEKKEAPKRRGVVRVTDEHIEFNDGLTEDHAPSDHYFEGARVSNDSMYIVWKSRTGDWAMCTRTLVNTALLASGKLYTEHEYSAVGTRDWIINPVEVVSKLHELSEMAADIAAVYMRGAQQAQDVRVAAQRVVDDQHVVALFENLKHVGVHAEAAAETEVYQAAGKLIGMKLDNYVAKSVYRPPSVWIGAALVLVAGGWFADAGVFTFGVGLVVASLLLGLPWLWEWWRSDAWVWSADGRDCARTPPAEYEKIWAPVPTLLRKHVTPSRSEQKFDQTPDPRKRMWWALAEELAALAAAIAWRHGLGFDSNVGALLVLVPIAAYELGAARRVTEVLVWRSGAWFVLLTSAMFYWSTPVHLALNWYSAETSCSAALSADILYPYDLKYLDQQKREARHQASARRQRLSSRLRGGEFPLGRKDVSVASALASGVTAVKHKEQNPKVTVTVHANTERNYVLPNIATVARAITLNDGTFNGPIRRYTALAQAPRVSAGLKKYVVSILDEISAHAAKYPHVKREVHIDRKNENGKYGLSGPKRRAYHSAVRLYRRWGYRLLKALTMMIKVEPMISGAGPAYARAIVFGNPGQPAWWGSGVARVLRVLKSYFGVEHPWVHLVCGMRSTVVAALIGEATAGGCGFGADARGADNEFSRDLQQLVGKMYRAAGATRELCQALERHTRVPVYASDGSLKVEGADGVMQSGRPDTSAGQSARFAVACSYVAQQMFDESGVETRTFVCSDDIYIVVKGLQGEAAREVADEFVRRANAETSSEFEITSDGTFLAGVPIEAGEAVVVRKPTIRGWVRVASRWKLLQHPGRVLPKLGVASYTNPGKREASWAASSLAAAAIEYRGIPLVDSALRGWARELGVEVRTEVYPEYARFLGAEHRLPVREAEGAYSVSVRGSAVDHAGLEGLVTAVGAVADAPLGPRPDVLRGDAVVADPCPESRPSKGGLGFVADLAGVVDPRMRERPRTTEELWLAANGVN